MRAKHEVGDLSDQLERTKFIAPGEPKWVHDPDDESEQVPWPDHSVMDAQDVLRLSRFRRSCKNGAHGRATTGFDP